MGSHGNCVLGRAECLLSRSLSVRCHFAWGQHSEDCRCGRRENSSLASAHTPSPLSFLLLCSSLSPSLLFVLGTYQPEKVKRRREGGGVIQHVRQGRGGKKRIACGAGHREQTVRLPEQDWRTHLTFCFVFWTFKPGCFHLCFAAASQIFKVVLGASLQRKKV